MKNIIVFGCGKTLESYINALIRYYKILFICDNDSNKWGKRVLGGKVFEVKNPDVLTEYTNIEVFIISIYWSDIYEQLYRKGLRLLYSPMSTRPLLTDLPFCKNLNDYIYMNYEKWFGNRTDVDVDSYRETIYFGWNNHFRMHRMLETAITKGKIRKGAKILDYGCGVGTLGLSSLLRGYDFWGVDIEIWKHEFIIDKIRQLEYPSEWEARFILYNGDKLPFEDNTFDCVISYQVLEHVNDVNESIKEILRVCRNDGIVYLHCPNYDRSYEEHYLVEFGEKLRGNKERFKAFVRSYGADDVAVDYINFINKQDVKDAIEGSGDYEVIDLIPYDDLADVDFFVKKRN